VLAVGGNLNRVESDGQITALNAIGCEIVSTSHIDSEFTHGIGTSFASPVIASIAADLVDKFIGHSNCFYKALIASSCERLVDGSGKPHDASVQGFGVPRREFALDSTFYRVTVCAEGTFDLRLGRRVHRYRFLFPDNADQIRVTLCFDVEPLLGSTMPYDIMHKLRKPGTRFTTYARPKFEIAKQESNIRQYEYEVKRAGRGFWTLEVSPSFRAEVLTVTSAPVPLRYAVVVTIISTKRLDVYKSIRAKVTTPQPQILRAAPTAR
jgi:hypothetical protein